jgi:hypothetical protein
MAASQGEEIARRKKTEVLGKAMKEFNPDSSWQEAKID